MAPGSASKCVSVVVVMAEVVIVMTAMVEVMVVVVMVVVVGTNLYVSVSYIHHLL